MENYIISEIITTCDEVRLVLLNLTENTECINAEIIPPVQIHQISEYRIRRDSKKRLLARSYLYEFIAEHYGVSDFTLHYNEHKKPFLRAIPELNFNFSYSEDYVLIGMSKGRRIGVDIEYVNPSTPVKTIAGEFMNLAELACFRSHDANPASQRQLFFKIFSMKEALTKALGMGLHFNLKAFNSLIGNTYYHNGVQFSCKVLYLWNNTYTLSLCYENL